MVWHLNSGQPAVNRVSLTINQAVHCKMRIELNQKVPHSKKINPRHLFPSAVPFLLPAVGAYESLMFHFFMYGNEQIRNHFLCNNYLVLVPSGVAISPLKLQP
jgi:hypothetical protein